MEDKIPEWILKYKIKGTQISKIGAGYYLYKVSSKWNPNKKRSQKVTEKYLGAITKDGLVPAKQIRIQEMYKQISPKEYGATYFLQSISKDVIEELKKHFPYEWKELFSLAVFRLTEKSPLKNIDFYYKTSYLSESIKGVRTSQPFLGKFLREVGIHRETIKSFMRSFIIDTEYAIIDLTNIFSYAEGMISAVLGHNRHSIYLPQINLILIYSLDKLQPAYFRQVPGSIRDISTVIRTINEIPMENFVLIGDKGFHSDENVKELQKKEINYVLALKRDSDYINYNRIKDNDRKKFDGYFMYNKKHIWFCIQKINDGEKIITYLDETLKAEEESDILRRITYLENISKEKKLSDKEKKQLSDNKERLYDKSHRNGTLSVRTNLDKSAEEVYQIMKSRINVEQAFDTFKNTLEADRSYMRDEKQLEGWLFINFIAMQLYYKIYAMLLDKKMLNNYSPVDVLIHLKRVYMLRMADKWQLSEMPKQSRDIIKKMNIDIPIT
jgi:hypothetical protein